MKVIKAIIPLMFLIAISFAAVDSTQLTINAYNLGSTSGLSSTPTYLYVGYADECYAYVSGSTIGLYYAGNTYTMDTTTIQNDLGIAPTSYGPMKVACTVVNGVPYLAIMFSWTDGTSYYLEYTLYTVSGTQLVLANSKFIYEGKITKDIMDTGAYGLAASGEFLLVAFPTTVTATGDVGLNITSYNVTEISSSTTYKPYSTYVYDTGAASYNITAVYVTPLVNTPQDFIVQYAMVTPTGSSYKTFDINAASVTAGTSNELTNLEGNNYIIAAYEVAGSYYVLANSTTDGQFDLYKDSFSNTPLVTGIPASVMTPTAWTSTTIWSAAPLTIIPIQWETIITGSNGELTTAEYSGHAIVYWKDSDLSIKVIDITSTQSGAYLLPSNIFNTFSFYLPDTVYALMVPSSSNEVKTIGNNIVDIVFTMTQGATTADINDVLQVLQQYYQGITNQLTTISNAINSISQTLSSIETNYLQPIEQTVNTINTNVNTVYQTVSSIEQTTNTISSNVNTILQDVQNILNLIGTSSNTIFQYLEDINNTVYDTNARVQDIQNQLIQIQSTLQSVYNEATLAYQAANNAYGAVTNLNNYITNILATNINNIANEVDAIKTIVDQLPKNITEIQGILDSLSSQMTTTLQELDALRTDVQTNMVTLNEIYNYVKDINNTVTANMNMLNQLSSTLSSAISALESEIQTVQSTLKDNSTTIMTTLLDLKTKLSDLNNTLATTYNALNTTMNTIESVATEITKLNNTLSTYMSEINNAYSKLLDSINLLNNNVAELQSKINTCCQTSTTTQTVTVTETQTQTKFIPAPVLSSLLAPIILRRRKKKTFKSN